MHERQLSSLADVSGLLADAGLDWWLFGGWAVDFHVGAVTRPHDDIDVAVWLHDVPRIDELLRREAWAHAPLQGEDGGTGYEREHVRLELTYLVRGDDGRVFVPFESGRGEWDAGAFADDVRQLRGVWARVITRAALLAGKSRLRGDADDVAKDRVDLAVLLGRGIAPGGS